ncbi:MAG: sulfate adenylyltransferase, partial [Euryarchaeota archaeon]|nr:sulfate adenylyltransferase [Euryarchaeota archaeon]
MSRLVPPHGSKELKPLLLEGEELEKEKEKAKGLNQVMMTSRETGDLIMMGIGGFTPLEGFMGKADWKGVCENMYMETMKDAHTGKNLFWPIP